MAELTVGIRELKAHLSDYLRQVQNGQAVVITDHGEPIGQILPIEKDLQKQIENLQAAGLVAWNGKKLGPMQSPAMNRSGKLASDLVVEMREQDL